MFDFDNCHDVNIIYSTFRCDYQYMYVYYYMCISVSLCSFSVNSVGIPKLNEKFK